MLTFVTCLLKCFCWRSLADLNGSCSASSNLRKQACSQSAPPVPYLAHVGRLIKLLPLHQDYSFSTFRQTSFSVAELRAPLPCQEQVFASRAVCGFSASTVVFPLYSKRCRRSGTALCPVCLISHAAAPCPLPWPVRRSLHRE